MEETAISKNSNRVLSLLILLLTLMLYPTLSTFWHHEYPVFSIEFFYLLLISVALSLLLAILLANTRDMVVNSFLILMTTIVLMVQFDLLLEGLILSFVVLGVIALVTKRRFVVMMTPIFVALILGSYIDSWMDRERNRAVSKDNVSIDESLPPVIHIILDQFMALDGLPPETPAQLFRETALDFFEANDFQVYTRAYSNYVNTEDSLSQAFNFKNSLPDTPKLQDLLMKNYSFKKNEYLEGFRKKGYGIRIYQSEGMDFCQSVQPAPEKCWTYTIPNLISIHNGYENPLDRMKIILRVMISQSRVLNQIAVSRGFSRPGGFSYFNPELFDEMAADIETQPNGRIYFAHVLFPHTPFVYLGNCQLNYGSEKQWRFSSNQGLEANSPLTRGNRYIHYLEQSRCALKKLGNFFDQLREQGIYDEAVILVHGDHGSTIYEQPPMIEIESSLTTNDLLDAYSTLFAVKMPHDRFEVHEEVRSLASLIQQFASKVSEPIAGNVDTKNFVYLKSATDYKRLDANIYEARVN